MWILCSVNIEALANVRSHDEKIDSLEKILESEAENNLRPDYILKILNELCWELRGTDTEKALGYGKNGLTMAQEYLKNSTEQSEVLMYKKAIAISLNSIGVVYEFKNDYEKALQYYSQALEKNEELGDQKGLAITLLYIADIHKMQKSYQQCIKYVDKSIKAAKQVNAKGELKTAYGLLSEVYELNGDYKNALDFTKLKNSLLSYEDRKSVV